MSALNKNRDSLSHEVRMIGNSSIPIYKYKDIDFSNIEVSELNKEGTQPLSYISYNDPIRNMRTRILVQTGRIKLTSHGIPPLDREDSKNHYYPDDSKREFIKIPLDPDQPACVELKKFLEKVDSWAGSSEIRRRLFGKKEDKYEYQSCIKIPLRRDDDESNDEKIDNVKNERTSVEYVKMKFNVVQQGKERVNRTKIVKNIGGKQREQINANTITDIANEIRFLSEIRLIFYFSKIWANKIPAHGASKIMYGIGFKVMAIEYTPNIRNNIDLDNIDFLSDEEESKVNESVKNNVKKDSKDKDNEEEFKSKDDEKKIKNEDIEEEFKKEDNEQDDEKDISGMSTKKSFSKNNKKKTLKDIEVDIKKKNYTKDKASNKVK
ncbi:MAG: hypothetical protein QXW79_01285 [Thermoplasmata archaeon]